MADKFRKTHPLKITFSQGEQPTAQKLTAATEQGRAGSDLLERAIGDLWNESADPSLTDNPLQIPNLARLLGQNEYLNPALYPGNQVFTYTETVGAHSEGLTEFYLKFRPENATIAQLVGSNFTAEQSAETDVSAAGQYWVDYATGRVRTYNPLTSTEKISYTVDPVNTWHVGDETIPGVIPDPGQTEFTSCRISTSAGKFLLHLPPRRPLTLSDREKPHNYPASVDYSDNEASGDGAPFKYFNDGVTAITGITSSHYRYALPKDILDTLGTLTSGTQLPSGFMYLWDQSTNTVLFDIKFSKPGDAAQPDYVLEIESDTIDLSFYVTNDETEVSYSNTGLTLITCGAPLARTVWTLLTNFYKHGHDQGAQDKPVTHQNLTNKNPPTTAYTTGGHNLAYPNYLPPWAPSNWAMDDHTYLLSRAGSHGVGDERDPYNNAMLGHLVMANADTSGSDNYIDSTLPDNSFNIYFGDVGAPRYISAGSSGISLVGEAGDAMFLAADGTMLGLLPGSTFGSSVISRQDGHMVVKLSPNDNNDAFAVFGDSTVSQGATWDKVLFYVNNSGDAGIATSSPNAKLEIVDDNTSHPNVVRISQDDNTQWGLMLSNLTFSASTTVGLGLWVGDDGYTEIRATSNALILNATGQWVGIGLPNPQTPDRTLHIYDQTPAIRLEHGDTVITTGENLGMIEWEHNDTDNPGVAAQMWLQAQGPTGLTTMRLNTGTPGSLIEALRIHNGEVAIGDLGASANLPQRTLHVVGDGYFEDGVGVNIQPVTGSGALIPMTLQNNNSSSFGSCLYLRASPVGNSDGPKIDFFKDMTTDKIWRLGIANGVNVDDFALYEDGGPSTGFGTLRTQWFGGTGYMQVQSGALWAYGTTDQMVALVSRQTTLGGSATSNHLIFHSNQGNQKSAQIDNFVDGVATPSSLTFNFRAGDQNSPVDIWRMEYVVSGNRSEFYNQKLASQATAHISSSTSGLFLRGTGSTVGQVAVGPYVTARTQSASDANLEVYDNTNNGKMFRLQDPGISPVGSYAHINIEPFSANGVGTLPTSGVIAGDIFCASEYAPDRIYFYNGSSWVQMA